MREASGPPRGMVMFTPLPPRQNGIAAYAAEILPALAAGMLCTAVVEDGSFDTLALPGVEVLWMLEYRARMHEFRERVHVYQVGNNPDHLYMLPTLAEQPGVVVLHDPSLHHLADLATLGTDGPDAYAAALEAEYGAAGRAVARGVFRSGVRERRVFLDLPMLRGLLGPSLGVIVHSRFAAAKALAQVPDVPVRIVPHQFSPPPAEQVPSRAAVRHRLGLDENEIVFISLGFVTRAKQIDAALRALAAIRHRLPPFRYLIAGELRPDEVDVHSLAEALGLADRVRTLGYVAESDFFSLIGASDVVINLRHPVAGETSGTMIRALGQGACVVVVDSGAFAEIPDGAACKVHWGPGREERLAATLLRLAHDTALRERIGRAAAAMTRKHNALSQTVEGYRAAIEAAAEAPPRRWATKVRVWERPTPAALAQQLRRRGADAAAPPRWFGPGGLPRADEPCRMMVIADHSGGAELVEDKAIHLSPEAAASNVLEAAAPQRGVDLVLLAVRASAPLGEAEMLLRRINARMGFGAVLVVNVALDGPGGAAVLGDRGDGAALLERCGFRVESFESAAPSVLGGLRAPPSRERCWRTVKTSEFFLPSPAAPMPAPATAAHPGEAKAIEVAA
jgi:glycosyltransferase involved in cell wall biosynthesis